MSKRLTWSEERSLSLDNFTREHRGEAVAQVSNLLYRGFPIRNRARRSGHPADWKSAIRQVGNLRYEAMLDDCARTSVIYPG